MEVPPKLGKKESRWPAQLVTARKTLKADVYYLKQPAPRLGNLRKKRYRSLLF
jgi:hypothetical protein